MKARAVDAARAPVRAARLLFATAVPLLVACGGAQPTTQGVLLPDERQLACDTLLEELGDLDTASLDEPTLQRRIDQAVGAIEPCRGAWARDTSHSASAVFADHRANQLMLRALTIEAAMSARFDGGANFCAILRETFSVLLQDLAALQAALDAGRLPPQGVAALEQLRDLDMQALDVLALGADRLCFEQ